MKYALLFIAFVGLVFLVYGFAFKQPNKRLKVRSRVSEKVEEALQAVLGKDSKDRISLYSNLEPKSLVAFENNVPVVPDGVVDHVTIYGKLSAAEIDKIVEAVLERIDGRNDPSYVPIKLDFYEAEVMIPGPKNTATRGQEKLLSTRLLK